MPMRVLPQPAPPQTNVGLPLGSPPPVISSSPGMPVAHFGKLAAGDAFCFVTVLVKGQSFLVGYRHRRANYWPRRQRTTLAETGIHVQVLVLASASQKRFAHRQCSEPYASNEKSRWGRTARAIDHIGLFTDGPPGLSGSALRMIFRRSIQSTDCGGINQGNSRRNKDLAARHALLS